MEWNLEWVDLQNMERMTAECWRMSERQLAQYVQELSKRRSLAFAGALGEAFFALMCAGVSGGAACDWAKLQKDIHVLQKLISDGANENADYWGRQYDSICEQPEFYFYTPLGDTFLEVLAKKLERGLSAAQRDMCHDLQKIQDMCVSCDTENEAQVQAALAALSKGQPQFDSWVGKSFAQQFTERFAKKDEPQPEQKKRVKRKKKAAPVRKNTRTKTPQFKAGNEKAAVQKKRRSKRWAVVMLVAAGLVCAGFYLHWSGVLNRLLKFYDASGGKTNDVGISIQAQPDGHRTAQKSDAQTTEVETFLDTRKNGSVSAEEPSKVPDTQADTGEEADSALQDTQESAAQDTAQTDMPEILAEYKELHTSYPEVFGWLNIPGTTIDTPVMQTEDTGGDYFYLHHDYTGADSKEGALFVDSKSSLWPLDSNLVIYGHNMSNGRNFGTLGRFTDREYFKKHRRILFDTVRERGVYRAVAVLKSRILYQDEPGFRYYRFFNYGNREEFSECARFVENNRLFDSGEPLRYGDRLLMLSTCDYSQENGRLVLVAKRVEE